MSAVFITFSGNCRKALTFYQGCFGGTLRLETFGEALDGYPETPVISGSLVSDRVVIHGSDLVHNEGRTLGNYISYSCTVPMHLTEKPLLKNWKSMGALLQMQVTRNWLK